MCMRGLDLSLSLPNPLHCFAGGSIVNSQMSSNLFQGVTVAQMGVVNPPLGQISLRGFDQEVVVIIHQAIGMAEPMEPLITERRSKRKSSRSSSSRKISYRAFPREVM